MKPKNAAVFLKDGGSGMNLCEVRMAPSLRLVVLVSLVGS